MKPLFAAITILLSLTCNYNLLAQNENDTVVVIPIKMGVHANAQKIGTIKAGNNATETHCDYEAVIAEAKQKAKAMGGNVVKITALVPPAFVSKCYRIDADVYYDPQLRDSLMQLKTKNSNTPDNPKDYVLLYIYRLADTAMLSPSYSLHLGSDTVLCTVKKKSGTPVKVYRAGTLTLWGKAQHRGELKLDAKLGETYYIRCGLSGGEFNKTPVIEHIDEKTGATEYTMYPQKGKETEAKYLMEVH